LRQDIEASRMIGATEMVQETVVRKSMQELASGDVSHLRVGSPTRPLPRIQSTLQHVAAADRHQ